MSIKKKGFSRVAPWFSADREWIGLLPWEKMSWPVYMPGAGVGGWIEVEGRKYILEDVSGYHDHNWGEWIPCNMMWNWIQSFEPGFSLEVGEFRLHPAGVMNVEFQGERTVFDKLQYHIIHTCWDFDGENRKFFPEKHWRCQLRLCACIYDRRPIDGEIQVL